MSVTTEYFEAALASAQRTADELSASQRDEILQQADALPLRRDMATLLSYVRDNAVVGTQSTGNLPLKAVREITAHFVHPPRLDEKIGNYTYRVRSEADLWPLYYLHILADVGGLAKSAPARRWRVTRQGSRFLALDPWAQVVYLLATWWDRVDWVVAYPFEGMGRGLPPYFTATTWEQLDGLPVNRRIVFEQFADHLIAATGMRWTVPNEEIAHMALHGAVRRMVMSVLNDFEAVTLEYQDKPLGTGTIRDLIAFRMTPFGKQLLEALVL